METNATGAGKPTVQASMTIVLIVYWNRETGHIADLGADLERWEVAWNGQPVVVQHPEGLTRNNETDYKVIAAMIAHRLKHGTDCHFLNTILTRQKRSNKASRQLRGSMTLREVFGEKPNGSGRLVDLFKKEKKSGWIVNPDVLDSLAVRILIRKPGSTVTQPASQNVMEAILRGLDSGNWKTFNAQAIRDPFRSEGIAPNSPPRAALRSESEQVMTPAIALPGDDLGAPPPRSQRMIGLDLSDVPTADEAQRRRLDAVPPPSPHPLTALAYPNAAAVHYPRQLPVVFHIPHRRNPLFAGRAQLLSDLQASLTAGATAAVVQAIHGLGGVGKTQLAIEYAYRFGHLYDGVWWLNAETVDGITSGLASLAVRVGVAALETPIPEAAQLVLEWLRLQGANWLVIYDNATLPQDVQNALPQGGDCRVLLTSRHPDWETVGTSLRVKPWERSESVAFLHESTAQDDSRSADTLAHELGNLPLALAQAAGYIRSTRTKMAKYLELYRTKRQELWQDEGAPNQYDKTIATTWGMALERLSVPAAALLQLCAFLSPELFP